MKNHLWISEVLTDIAAFARQNDLHLVAGSVDQAKLTFDRETLRTEPAHSKVINLSEFRRGGEAPVNR